jgi:hypothetical protein
MSLTLISFGYIIQGTNGFGPSSYGNIRENKKKPSDKISDGFSYYLKLFL